VNRRAFFGLLAAAIAGRRAFAPPSPDEAFAGCFAGAMDNVLLATYSNRVNAPPLNLAAIHEAMLELKRQQRFPLAT
jgi:hypothetical protein